MRYSILSTPCPPCSPTTHKKKKKRTRRQRLTAHNNSDGSFPPCDAPRRLIDQFDRLVAAVRAVDAMAGPRDAQLLRKQGGQVGVGPGPAGDDGEAVDARFEFLRDDGWGIGRGVVEGVGDGLEHEVHGLDGVFDFLGLVLDVAHADYDWCRSVRDHDLMVGQGAPTKGVSVLFFFFRSQIYQCATLRYAGWKDADQTVDRTFYRKVRCNLTRGYPATPSA